MQKLHLQTKVELVAESVETTIDRCNLEREDKPAQQVEEKVAAELVEKV